MDGWTDRWTDRWTDDGQMDGQDTNINALQPTVRRHNESDLEKVVSYRYITILIRSYIDLYVIISYLCWIFICTIHDNDMCFSCAINYGLTELSQYIDCAFLELFSIFCYKTRSICNSKLITVRLTNSLNSSLSVLAPWIQFITQITLQKRQEFWTKILDTALKN